MKNVRDNNLSLEQKMKHNLEVLLPKIKVIYDKYANKCEGMTLDEAAWMIIEEFFIVNGLDLEWNRGLAQAIYALLRVKKLKKEDIVIIVMTDKDGNPISGDYTFPDWVPDKYVGKSTVQQMLEDER